MKQVLLLKVTLFVSIISFGQTANEKYDKALADSLGADEYGMKSYVFVILKTGPNKETDKEKLNQAFRGHMDNINKLASEGRLVIAGPFGKNDKSFRGIFILNVKTVEEANALLAGDPTISQKIFEVELYPWYGSAALPMYLSSHEKIEQQKH